MNTNKIQSYWLQFIQENQSYKNKVLTSTFYFDLNQITSKNLLKLVLEGKKTATTSSLYAFEYEKEPLPKQGDIYIITDFNQIPYCVVETTNVTILKFNEMTFELAQKEGEDENLDSWISNHQDFFNKQANDYQYIFNPDMPIVFEEFKVIYKNPIKV